MRVAHSALDNFALGMLSTGQPPTMSGGERQRVAIAAGVPSRIQLRDGEIASDECR